jgi:hypothetical protein
MTPIADEARSPSVSLRRSARCRSQLAHARSANDYPGLRKFAGRIVAGQFRTARLAGELHLAEYARTPGVPRGGRLCASRHGPVVPVPVPPSLPDRPGTAVSGRGGSLRHGAASSRTRTPEAAPSMFRSSTIGGRLRGSSGATITIDAGDISTRRSQIIPALGGERWLCPVPFTRPVRSVAATTHNDAVPSFISTGRMLLAAPRLGRASGRARRCLAARFLHRELWPRVERW